MDKQQAGRIRRGATAALVAVVMAVGCGTSQAPPPSPTPRSSPTPTQAEAARAWSAKIAMALTDLDVAMDDLQAACATPVDLARCKDAYGKVSGAAFVAVNNLDATPAPACKATSARAMRDALSEVEDGAYAMSRARDVGEMTAGAAMMRIATESMRRATATAQSESCA